jgi:hypothetical protein
MFTKNKTFRQALGILLVTIMGVSFLALPVNAALISPDDQPSELATATGGEGSARVLARTIVDYFLAFLGFLATLMIIYGGILYVTAAGNEENAKKGKTIIMYAAVGIIIILLSYAIVNTILGAASTPAA